MTLGNYKNGVDLTDVINGELIDRLFDTRLQYGDPTLFPGLNRIPIILLLARLLQNLSEERIVIVPKKTLPVCVI